MRIDAQSPGLSSQSIYIDRKYIAAITRTPKHHGAQFASFYNRDATRRRFHSLAGFTLILDANHALVAVPLS